MFTPSTVVRLLQNVDIDDDYSNTFTFVSEASQHTFFIGKTKLAFENVTYVRKEKVLRLGVNVESLWDVSYMMFQNANFGSKWFYAFITDMKYVNDDLTEITFSIDVLQTWYFNIELKDCYIEREHVSDDTVGLHLVEENLNVGEYVINSSENVSELTDLSIVLSSTVDELGADVTGLMYTGVYSGNAYMAYTTHEGVNALISALSGLGKAEAINNIFMMPSAFVPTGETVFVAGQDRTLLDKSVTKNLTALDGYTPKNKKLLTYPYNFLVVTNNHGQSTIYRYEMSSDTDMVFYVSSDIAPSPIIYLIPRFYKGTTNYEESLTLTGFPLCNWSTDIYKIWMSQNAVSNAVNIGGSALALGVGVATANPVAVGSGVLGVAGSIGTFYEKAILPNSIHGGTSGSANVAQGIQNFTFLKKTIRAEYAKIIDQFFDRFGYKVNLLKTPVLKTRTNWNYLKTMECNISGNIPNSDLKKIHEIFNQGVTYWHNDNVGNYNRTNATI